MSRVIIIYSVIIFAGVIFFFVGSRYAFQKACKRRASHPANLETADDEQNSLSTKNEKIIITASDGVRLVGYFYERKKNAPIVIFFHGLWSTGFVNGKPIYRITEKHNWNLLLATLRAHGESGGEYSTFGALEKYDCRDWVSWARKRFGTESLIFLIGISMGGAIAMLSSNLEGMECVRGIIDEGGYTSPLEMIEINSRDKLQSKFLVRIFSELVNVGARIWGRCNLRGVDACKALMNTKIPVLIIHGDMDNLAPLYMAKEIYNSCKSSKEIYIVHGAGHAENYKKDPEGYEKIITTFIKERSTTGRYRVPDSASKKVPDPRY